jgi:DNA-binding protein YbaB
MNTTLNAVHHQAIDWLRELDFYTDEITLLSGRLSTAALKNTRSDLKADFESFKKQFEELAKRIATMKSDVKVREGVVETLTVENKGEDKEVTLDNDIILKEMKALLQDIADARFMLNLFLAQA